MMMIFGKANACLGVLKEKEIFFNHRYRIVTILYRCTGFVTKGGVGALYI